MVKDLSAPEGMQVKVDFVFTVNGTPVDLSVVPTTEA